MVKIKCTHTWWNIINVQENEIVICMLSIGWIFKTFNSRRSHRDFVVKKEKLYFQIAVSA